MERDDGGDGGEVQDARGDNAGCREAGNEEVETGTEPAAKDEVEMIIEGIASLDEMGASLDRYKKETSEMIEKYKANEEKRRASGIDSVPCFVNSITNTISFVFCPVSYIVLYTGILCGKSWKNKMGKSSRISPF